MNVYNPIYDEIVKEVESGIIKKGINRNFENCKFRMDNVENGNYTKDDIRALFISAKLEKDEAKFALESEEARNETSIIFKEMFSLNSSIYNVPASLRNKDVILNFMYFQSTFEYIKSHINEYDCQFFKDKIETNFILVNDRDKNIFSIMPLEYIDEEMCLLAVLSDDTGGNWFREVYKRKPEVLTESLWKLAVRFYVFSVQDAID